MQTTNEFDDSPPGGSFAGASHWSAIALTGAFIATIFVPGLYQARYGLGKGDLKRWTSLARQEPSASQAIRTIERDFDQRFLPAQMARTLVAGVPVKPVRFTLPSAQAGTDGFLFYGVDIRVTTGAGFCDRRLDRGIRAANAIIDLANQLRQRGVHFLLVPVPAKSSIYPEHLDPHYDVHKGPNLNIDHAQWIQRLEEGGVDVLDPTDLFWAERYAPAGLVFYPADTHWTQRGMTLAVEQIARRIAPLLADAPGAPPFHRRLVPYRAVGDLVGMDDIVVTGKEPQVRDMHLQLYDDQGVVNPGNDAPVLVLGDSYPALFADTGSGLAQMLMANLGIEVQSAAAVGGTGNTMRTALLRPGILEKKRVVVLCFTIRLLVCCDWEPIKIEQGAGH